eukprot:799126-Prymnesium_polylepis.1
MGPIGSCRKVKTGGVTSILHQTHSAPRSSCAFVRSGRGSANMREERRRESSRLAAATSFSVASSVACRIYLLRRATCRALAAVAV